MNASLDEKLRNVKWGEYKINQLFKPVAVKRKLKGEDIAEKGIFPAYSSDSENNGIVGYYKIPEFICDLNNPVYVIFGDHTRTMSIARKSFSVLDNVKVLHSYIDKNNALLFVFSVWKKQIPNLGYKRHWSIAKKCVLELPERDGKLDIAFMESFIAELEAERVAELSAYLKVSGLDNYELSKEEEKVVEITDTHNINWCDYRLGDLFCVHKYKKRFDANKVTIHEAGKYPYVVRMSGCNGQKGFINENEKYLNEGNTLSFGQDTATIFYQEKPFFTGDKIKILKCKNERFNKQNAQFFVAAIAKAFSSYSWGSSSYSVDTIENQIIKLPTKDGEIDFDFMKLLISAIQKLVIKDVVQYANQKISATKQITCTE